MSELVSCPAVSVIVAAFNSARWIDETLDALRSQSLRALEIIVIDDGSSDDTAQRVAAVALQDPRVRLLSMTSNGGAARARNAGLAVARGRWIGIVDSDDIVTPDRFERLVAAAEAEGVDIACDNMILFSDTKPMRPEILLKDLRAPRSVDALGYILGNSMAFEQPSLGYLQPIIRAECLRGTGVRYDEDLRIAEDYDFVLRLLIGGASMRLFPWPTYFYRKRAGSVSERLTVTSLRLMIGADDRFRALPEAREPGIRDALDRRRRKIEQLTSMTLLVNALKQRRPLAAAAIACRRPHALWELRQPLQDRLRRLLDQARGRSAAAPGLR